LFGIRDNMLLRHVRILNFDNSITQQKNFIKSYNPTIVDLSHLGLACRLWPNKAQADEIRRSLDPDLKNSVTLLGSGDFHYVSSLLIEQFQEPFSVILFDHHPDWDIMPPKLGCGAWVSRVVEKSAVTKVILLGMASSDLSTLGLMTGNLSSLNNNRVEIYPYSYSPLVSLRRVPKNASVEVRKGVFSSKLYWKELKGRDLKSSFGDILKRVPTSRVYVSIDKDCLRADDALTNWEEGRLKLEELLAMLRLIKEHRDIIALDITGDYSPVVVSGFWKRIACGLDHPKDYTAYGKSQELITSINEKTNQKILETLLS